MTLYYTIQIFAHNVNMVLIHQWCIINKISINFSKTKHMLIPRNTAHETTVEHSYMRTSNVSLENVSIYHYLGIDLDKNVSFEKIVENTKANTKLYLLKKIRPYITCSIAKTGNKTDVLQILDYADFPVDSCIKRKVGTLDQIQKRAVHIIDGKTNFGQLLEGLMNI